jgi:hypothetical protein
MTYHSLGRKSDSDAALVELVRKYEGTSAFSIAAVLHIGASPNARSNGWTRLRTTTTPM